MNLDLIWDERTGQEYRGWADIQIPRIQSLRHCHWLLNATYSDNLNC